MGSPILKAAPPPGAVAPKGLLLQHAAPWQLLEVSSGEGDFHPLPPGKASSPAMGLFKSVLAILLMLETSSPVSSGGTSNRWTMQNGKAGDKR